MVTSAFLNHYSFTTEDNSQIRHSVYPAHKCVRLGKDSRSRTRGVLSNQQKKYALKQSRLIAISRVLRVFSDGQTNRQTDRQTDRPTEWLIELRARD